MPAAIESLRTRSARVPHYWPTADQLDLLRAALLRGEPALAAWGRWKTRVRLDEIHDLKSLDRGSQRLLPLLANNLELHGVGDPQLHRLAATLHYTWVQNHRRLARISPLVQAFHDAGIRAMFLKGLALSRHYCAHMGLRPMDDVDLLVPTRDAVRAMNLLRGAGWQSPPIEERDLAMAHSRPYLADDGNGVDLHWKAMWEWSGLDADEGVWARAHKIELDHTPIWIPAPADLFLQVVVHGARWNAIPPIRWVSDAMAILSANHAFDWADLVAQAKAHSLVLPIGRALAFLQETFDAPVPASVMTELSTYQASTFERVEQRMREWTSTRVGCFPLVLCHHVRLTRSEGPMAVVWRLPRYLQVTYSLPALRSLPGALWVRAARRLRVAGSATP